MSKSASKLPEFYVIPGRHMQGSLAEMLFWDVVYYLLAARGETNPRDHRFVETNYEELQLLSGLTRKTLRKMLDQSLTLSPPYQLREEEGILPQSWILKHTHYNELKQIKSIQKPMAVMANGWGWVLAQPYPGQEKTSRFPLAVLNVLLRKPNGRTTTFAELKDRVKKKGAHKPPDTRHIRQSVSHLESLGLVNGKNNEYWVIREQFEQDGRTFYQRQMNPPSQRKTEAELIKWANQLDRERAQIAMEIVRLGQFDLATNFKEIFLSLGQIQLGTDLVWLRYAAHRHRHRIHSRRRWQACWQLFQNTLQRQHYGAATEKVRFNFGQKSFHKATLFVSKHNPQQLRWGKLVVWVNDGRFASCGLGREESVQVQLWYENRLLWQYNLSYENEVVRHDLTAVMRQQSSPIFRLIAEAPNLLPQFSLEGRLEAQYLYPREE